MSYIGSTPTTQSFISGTDYFNGDGSTVAFTLSRRVGSVNDIEVLVNNVEQQPNTVYTVSGTTLTFTTAPSSGTQNIYVRYLSTTTQAIAPSQGSVGSSQLQTNLTLAGTTTASTITSAAATALTLQSAGTTAVTVDASQNVGIGTSSPAVKVEIAGTGVLRLTNASGDAQLQLKASGTNPNYISYNLGGAGVMAFYDSNAGAERMRIDSTGLLIYGTTSSTAAQNANYQMSRPSAGDYIIGHINGTGSGSGYISFIYNAGVIGSITQSGTTAVLYNTTSDYRLKTDVAPIQNALATVEALNPVSFTWVDGRPDDGFIAHEIQAVLPNCVTGEKDAVNEDGTPKYQQMDNSGVIPFLVKAIQEQQALITDLTTRLSALEAK